MAMRHESFPQRVCLVSDSYEVQLEEVSRYGQQAVLRRNVKLMRLMCRVQTLERSSPRPSQPRCASSTSVCPSAASAMRREAKASPSWTLPGWRGSLSGIGLHARVCIREHALEPSVCLQHLINHLWLLVPVCTSCAGTLLQTCEH